MAGLTKAQLDMLKNMPGINQDLVSAYEKGGSNLTTTEKAAIAKQDTSPERIAEIASQPFVKPEIKNAVTASLPAATPVQKPAPTVSLPQANQSQTSNKDVVSNFSMFNAALNEAVNLARQQRQSAELDFLSGAIPAGAVSAGQFTGLLANLNRASTQFTEPLVNNVMEFAQNEQEYVREQQNQIRELALVAMENGADQSAIQGILAAPSIDSAISMASGVMQNTTSDDMDIRQVGANLVSVDKEGNVKVLFNGSSTSSGGGGGSTTTAEQPLTMNQIDQFRRAYGWTPPAGFTMPQLIQFMNDNPDASPEELEEGARMLAAELNGGGDGTVTQTVTRPSVEEVKSQILYSVNDTQMSKLKDKAGDSGYNAGGSWFFNAGVGMEGVKDYLDSIDSKIQTAIDENYTIEEIITFLTS